jgi:hypothetical protein
MKRILITLLILSMTTQAEWQPPEKPNPSAILQEAKEDFSADHFEEALAKQIWFHENALKIEPAQYGVRLSFALVAWRDLAVKYPPAMEALRHARDTAESNVQTNDGTFESFHDAVSLNDILRESGRTVTLFKWVDEHKPEQAKRALGVADHALIAAKEYALCGKYVEPQADYDASVRGYRQNLKMSKEKRFKNMKDFGEEKFSSDVGTLVALLVLNDRKDEAKTIKDKAIKEWDDQAFQERLDKALRGVLPPAFPSHDY